MPFERIEDVLVEAAQAELVHAVRTAPIGPDDTEVQERLADLIDAIADADLRAMPAEWRHSAVRPDMQPRAEIVALPEAVLDGFAILLRLIEQDLDQANAMGRIFAGLANMYAEKDHPIAPYLKAFRSVITGVWFARVSEASHG